MQRLMSKLLEGARFPTLLKVTAGLFVADLIIPDFIPLVDEVLLGLGTLILSRWKADRSAKGPGGPRE